MPERIIRLKPEEVAKFFAEEEMIKRAKELLGKDFLGVEAVRNMEAKLKGVGVNIEFILDNVPTFPYTEEDLQFAKQNEEMLVLRARAMQQAGGTQQDVNIIDFRELFKKDPMGKLTHVFYFSRPDVTDWLKKGEDFEKDSAGEIGLGWALVKKEVLQGSTSKNWNNQEEALKQYGQKLQRDGTIHTEVRRRTATEAVWDTLLYYTNTGEQLLQNKYDWTRTRSFGSLVRVGRIDLGGLVVSNSFPGYSKSDVGACSSR